MKKLFVLLLIASWFMLHTSTVFAQYGQYGQPSPSQSILIDKVVGKANSIPPKGDVTNVSYVDNLSPSDVRFNPGQDVYFRLKIKNTSNITLTNVTVTDTLPAYIEPVEGPGSFNSATRVISFNAGDFAPDEEKFYFLKTRLFVQNQMPSDKGLFCLINRATASNGTVSDEDTAQLCVEKQVLGVTTVPQAGPEMGLLLLSGETALLGIGLFLRKVKLS